MQIAKQFVQWPFQNVQTINMTPQSFKFAVNAMSREKMEFNFPAVFTIGPKNDQESLIKYARFLLEQSNKDTDGLIRGIIEGETRTLSANLSIEDIFTGRSAFKVDIVSNVKGQLDQYGLEIYNANIEELKDSESSNYFRSLAQKIKAEAENKAKVEVAEQNKKGNIGSKEREAETRQRVATVEAETTLVENSRRQEILKSQADLEKTKAEQDFVIRQATIRSEQEAESLRMDLLREVEKKRQEMELEKQRAVELTKTTVSAETAIKEAEGRAQSQRLLAEAALYQKQKEAEGVAALYMAQAEGLQKLVSSFGGDTRALLSYTMLEKGVYEKLAEANAKAIKDMNPKITVWTHDPSQSMSTIQNLGKGLIPMLDTIENQTGYQLPGWLLQKTRH
jgi:flotillin